MSVKLRHEESFRMIQMSKLILLPCSETIKSISWTLKMSMKMMKLAGLVKETRNKQLASTSSVL